jgi:hypothetical protein
MAQNIIFIKGLVYIGAGNNFQDRNVRKATANTWLG